MKGRFSLGTPRCPRREIADGFVLPQSSAQAWRSLTEPLLMSLFQHYKPRSIPRSATFNGSWRHMRCCSRLGCSLVDRWEIATDEERYLSVGSCCLEWHQSVADLQPPSLCWSSREAHK